MIDRCGRFGAPALQLEKMGSQRCPMSLQIIGERLNLLALRAHGKMVSLGLDLRLRLGRRGLTEASALALEAAAFFVLGRD